MFSETQRIVNMDDRFIDALTMEFQYGLKLKDKLLKDFKAKDANELKSKFVGKTMQVVLEV